MFADGHVFHDPLMFKATVPDMSDSLWEVWAGTLELAFDSMGAVNESGYQSRIKITKAAALAVIRENGDRVFDNRSRVVVRALRVYWGSIAAGTSEGEPRSLLRWLRVEHEELLWEAAVRHVINGSNAADVANDAPAMPRGMWNTAKKLSGPKFDCRVGVRHSERDWLLIADAKRYSADAEITGSDLYKQWLYAMFSSKQWTEDGVEPDSVVNVLVMPGRPGTMGGTGLYRLKDGLGDHMPNFGTVLRFELDYTLTLQLFANGRVWPQLRERMVAEWLRMLAVAPGGPQNDLGGLV